MIMFDLIHFPANDNFIIIYDEKYINFPFVRHLG